LEANENFLAAQAEKYIFKKSKDDDSDSDDEHGTSFRSESIGVHRLMAFP
jgi:hypothetical protein